SDGRAAVLGGRGGAGGPTLSGLPAAKVRAAEQTGLGDPIAPRWVSSRGGGGGGRQRLVGRKPGESPTRPRSRSQDRIGAKPLLHTHRPRGTRVGGEQPGPRGRIARHLSG